jgi:hypothetical protein
MSGSVAAAGVGVASADGVPWFCRGRAARADAAFRTGIVRVGLKGTGAPPSESVAAGGTVTLPATAAVIATGSAVTEGPDVAAFRSAVRRTVACVTAAWPLSRPRCAGFSAEAARRVTAGLPDGIACRSVAVSALVAGSRSGSAGIWSCAPVPSAGAEAAPQTDRNTCPKASPVTGVTSAGVVLTSIAPGNGAVAGTAGNVRSPACLLLPREFSRRTLIQCMSSNVRAKPKPTPNSQLLLGTRQ